MRHPGAIVAVVRLAALVRDDLVHGRLVGRGVALDRDLRGHPSHGVRAAAMTGLDEQLRVGPQEPLVHRDLRPVGEDRAGIVPVHLDEAEDVVPAAAVEPRGALLELPEDLVHLEGRGKRFDEHRGLDRAAGEPERLFRAHQDVVPKTGLEVALELGQVDVGAAPLGEQRLAVMKEEDPEIEQPRGNRTAVHLDMLFDQMPAARPNHEHGGLLVEAVALPAAGVVVGDRPPHGVDQVGLAVEAVRPRRRVRVLEVGHEDRGPRVR